MATPIVTIRVLTIAALSVALGGCWTSAQDVTTSTRPGDRYVGQNVDAVVARLGEPTGRKKIDNDQMTYVWEIAPTGSSGSRTTDTGQGRLYGDGHTPGYMSDDSRICKLTVIVSGEGIVTQVTAEDLNGTGAPKKTFGLVGSVCADRGVTR